MQESFVCTTHGALRNARNIAILFAGALALLYAIGSLSIDEGVSDLVLNEDGRGDDVQSALAVSMIGGVSIDLEIVTTASAKARGLGGRPLIRPEAGMLFVYETPGTYHFWMKDMRFPIDIIWIGDDFRVVDITKRLAPETYPRLYTSREPAQYILEVASGYADAHELKTGDRLVL